MFKQFFICAALVAALVAPSNAQQYPTTEHAKQIEALVNKAAALFHDLLVFSGIAVPVVNGSDTTFFVILNAVHRIASET
jgi:hypothetical protein